MTVLTRIRPSGTSSGVVRELADPVAIHRRVMSGFGSVGAGSARKNLGVLWRLDFDSHRQPVLLVQSDQAGDWGALPAGWSGAVETKSIDAMFDAISASQVLRFLLRANVTRKINTKTGDDGVRRNGQRVPLRSPDRAIDWLIRRGDAAGFELFGEPVRLAVEARPEPALIGWRAGGPVTVEPVRFEGLLTVRDAGRLVTALRAGVGPAKAFGCGLLSIAPSDMS